MVVHGHRELNAIYPNGRMEDAWSEMQAALARRLGADAPISATRSGHQLALEGPDLVAEVVVGVLRTAATPQRYSEGGHAIPGRAISILSLGLAAL